MLKNNAESESELMFLIQCGAKRINDMNAIGIFTLEDILNAEEEHLKQMPGAYDWHIKRWKLQARCILENFSIVLEKPPVTNDFLYYDIETDRFQNLVWLIGIYNPKKKEFKQFLAKTPKDEKKILAEFDKYLSKQKFTKLCSFSGSGFDRRVLETYFSLYLDNSIYLNMEEFDLGLFVQLNFLSKIKDFQLKNIGDFFNYNWKYKHTLDGFMVALMYERHLKDKSYKINWKQLLDYNKDDVLVLPHILKNLNKIYNKK